MKANKKNLMINYRNNLKLNKNHKNIYNKILFPQKMKINRN